MSKNSGNIGTTIYMAPEVKYKDKYDMKSDIFGLALIGTELFNFEDKVSIIRRSLDRGNM